MSLAEARKVWGEKQTIYVNIPESIFYEGYEKTKQYDIHLLKSDPCWNKFFGLTEMGLMGVDENSRQIFMEGIRAIMDAINEAGTY